MSIAPPPDSEEYLQKKLEDISKDAPVLKASRAQYLAGLIMKKAKPFWRMLSHLENEFWEDDIKNRPIDNPVFICGLARSGTTILLETFARTNIFATHRYKDYPFVDTPILWNKWLDFLPQSSKDTTEYERAHLDGLKVSAQSPEALEEVLWQDLWDKRRSLLKKNKDTQDKRFSSFCYSEVLDHEFSDENFERYYKEHIQKLLFIRQKNRYLTKGNYNLTRIGYLNSLFKNPRFIIPIRNPYDHIASLMKQQSLFSSLHGQDTKILRYMQWAGHYEFGLDRRIIPIGSRKEIQDIQKAWLNKEEVKGWALYWAMLHSWLYKAVQDHEVLQRNVLFVSYEELCANPQDILQNCFDFCNLDLKARDYADTIKKPSYYKAQFKDEDQNTIKRLTKSHHKKFLSLNN